MTELFMFAGTLDPTVEKITTIVRIVLLAVLVLCALVMIVTTLLQSSANQAGSSAISGGETDSYLTHNKDNSRDGKLKRITITMASIMLGCLILYFCSGFIMPL